MIEKKTADAILQRKQHITLHGQKLTAEQPTIATLIVISELVSQLPTTTADATPLDLLKDLKNCKVIGDIIATLVYGVKRRKWWHFYHKNRCRRLSSWIVDNCSPAELCAVLNDIMAVMQLADFFVLTTSLKGMNLTKEVVEKTTVSGL